MFSSFSKEYNEIWNNNNNKTSKQKKTISKENIIYSNELVKDLKILKRCNSIESIDYFLEQRKKSYDMMNHLYSSENYLYSLEEEKKTNIIQKIKEWFKKAKDFVVSLFMGFIKKIQVLFAKIYRNSLCSIVNKFKPENFKNIDAKINFKHKYQLPFNVEGMKKGAAEYGETLVKYGEKFVEYIDKCKILLDEMNNIDLTNIKSEEEIKTRYQEVIDKIQALQRKTFTDDISQAFGVNEKKWNKRSKSFNNVCKTFKK